MLRSLDVLARVPLAPVLIAQAVRVRSRALILPEPPGRRTGSTGSGPGLRVLIVGDSSAAGVGAPTQDLALSGQLVSRLSRHYRVDWRLEAKTGATTRATHDRLAQMTPETYDVAVTALGVNDVTRGVSCRRWIRNQSDLHALLRQRFGVGRILASGLPPMGRFPLLPHPLRWILGQQASRFDRALAGLLADQKQGRHVPVDFPEDPRFAAADGYHPSTDAYAEWGELLAKLIAEG